MKIKTRKNAIVLIPPEQIWPPIQEIRSAHDRQYRRWMPHITLIYPFYSKQTCASLMSPLSLACSQIRAFQVTLARFHFFHHGRQGYTLWLDPDPDDPLNELQEYLWKILPECDDVRRFKSGFTPHLSVGQTNGRGALEMLLARLQKQWHPVTFTAREVSLISRDDPPGDIFHVEDVIPLMSEP